MKSKKFYISVICSIIAINLFSQQFIEQTGIAITGVNQGSVAWGDYDKDSYPDILLTGWDGTDPVTKIYRNNGNNTFTEQTGIVLPGVFLSSAAWGDYDNDGDIDILLTGTTTGVTSGAIAKIYRNTNGIFTDISAGLPGIYFGNVSWCDYNRDGRLDVLLTGMSDAAERICKIFQNTGNGVFSELKDTPFTGVQYSSAAWGDYDNDGYPDLLVTGQNAVQEREVKLYHNNGDGTFTNLTEVSFKAVYYSSAAWGDYNSDGLLDILYSGEDLNGKSLTLVYKNQGNNSFAEQTIGSLTGIKNGSVAWGDFNNDGLLDIFMAGMSNTARIAQIYSNCTENTFCSTSESLTGLTDCALSLADYDNDNDLDLLIGGMDPLGNLVSKVYRNNSPVPNNAPAAPANLTYITTGTTSFISWDRVTGDETSTNSISYNVGIGRSAGTSAFVSSHSALNGKRRITSLGNAFLENSFVFRQMRWDTTYYVSVQSIDNNYTGSSFSGINNMKITPVQPSGLRASYISTTSIRIKWIRGNGDRCIVFAKEGSSGSSAPVNYTTYFANSVYGEGSPLGATGWYCIYKGEADSVTLSGLETQKDYSVHVIELQGVNGSEIYASELNENLGVFSTGLFTNQSLASMVGLRRSSVAWGDYNNDGFLDALITGQNLAGFGTTKIYQNNANNTFTELTGLTLPGVYYSSVAWGDYNNDGFLDILITGLNDENGPISKVFKNNGNLTFTEQSDIILTGVYNSSALWGDYDNDADLDLIIAGFNNVLGPLTKVYRNDGNNVFTAQSGISLPGIQNGSIALGDYDNNGFLDLIVTGFIANNGRITKIFKNTGNNFQEQINISLPGASLSSAAWGDYDNDGNLDIILAGARGEYPNFNQFTHIYHNNGNNTFTELTTTQLPGISQGALTWGDYNNDGFLDILLTGYTGSSYIFKIFENNGNQTFTDNRFVQVPGAIGCDVKWADYDNDGDLDVLLSGYTGALISRVYKNNTFMIAGDIRPNARPSTPTGLKSVVEMGDVRLYWDPITNDETPVANMSYNVRIRLENTDQWYYSPQSLDNGSRSLVSLGNVQLNKFFNVKNPDSGKYFWQVQAVDQGFQGSAWSSVESFLIKSTQAYFKTDTVCLGFVTKFTDQSIVTEGIASWKWDFKDGTTSVLQNPVHTYAAAGTYAVKLLVTATTGTKDSLIQNVIVKARPKTAFTAPNVCIGTATPLTNTTALNGLTALVWTWTYGDGQTSAIQNPGTHTYALSGTHKAKLKTITSNGCSDSITKDVIVARYPETSISVLGDFQTVDGKLTFCDGLSLQLDAKVDPLYTYQWIMDGTDLSGAESKSYTVSKNSGSYNARITNTLANCVTVTEAKTINVKPAPSKPSISSDYKTGDCIGIVPIKLKVSQPVNDYKYGWSRYGTPINNSSSPFIENFLEEGDYTVTADLSGCKVTSEKFSVVYQGAPEKPKIFAQGPNKWYLATNTLDAKEYRWYFNERLLDGALKYYYVADQKLGVYRVSVGNENGCFTRSDSLRIPALKYSPETKSITAGDPFADLKIYPNPTPGMFNIEMDNKVFGELVIDIFTQKGKKSLNIIFEKNTDHFSSQIDLSGQVKGIYIINLKLDKYSSSRKIVVE